MSQPTTVLCPVGLQLSENRCATSVWIKSPRTGTKLTMFLGEARQRLAGTRVISRIAAAVAVGRGEAALTRDELMAFKKAHAIGPYQRPRRKGILGGGW